MNDKKTTVTELFSSVQLTLIIISLIVVASILGTIIPQGQPLDFYVSRYGQANTIILETLGMFRLYSSLWFKALLLLLCLNIIFCSLVRIPSLILILKKDNLKVDISTLMRKKHKITFISHKEIEAVKHAVQAVLEKKNWRVRSKDNAESILLFSEKHLWARLGAYIVHASIIIIFLGVLVGNYFGFKAFVFIPEGTVTSVIYQSDDEQSEISLPFTLRCNTFGIDYYANGMPKEYRSDLTIIEDFKETINKQITVNDPLNYRGLSFYQSSYRSITDQYLVEITQRAANNDGVDLKKFYRKMYIGAREQKNLIDDVVSLEIIDTGRDGHGHGPYKVRLDDGSGAPSEIVFEDKKPVSVTLHEEAYEILIRQRFATGLQVVKDPGVFLVYLGFGALLIGLYIAFFMSHQRLWVCMRRTEEYLTVIVGGSSSKNQSAFAQVIEEIGGTLENDHSLDLRRI